MNENRSLAARNIKQFLRTFSRNKLGVFGACLVLSALLVAFFAPVLTPYGTRDIVRDANNRAMTFASPNAHGPLGTDDAGHESSVSVAVSAEPPPPQPFALTCALPVRTARPGEAVALDPLITAPNGQLLRGPITLSYSVRGNAGASISSAGMVSAERGGVAIVSAAIPLEGGGTTQLAGECIITFGNPEPEAGSSTAGSGDGSGAGGAAGASGMATIGGGGNGAGSVGGGAAPRCDKAGKVAYCSLIDAPMLVRGAGQTQRLKAAIFRETGCGFGDVPSMEVCSPSAVTTTPIGSTTMLQPQYLRPFCAAATT